MSDVVEDSSVRVNLQQVLKLSMHNNRHIDIRGSSKLQDRLKARCRQSCSKQSVLGLFLVTEGKRSENNVFG